MLFLLGEFPITGDGMTDLSNYLRIKTEEVAAEVLDGEAVLINLSNGMYYNTEGVGGLVWQLIEAGYTVEGMREELCARFPVDPDTAETDLLTFCEQAIAEGLVVAQAGQPDASGESPGATGGDYAAPKLNAYRDMGDLLALDPPMPGLRDIPWKEPVDSGQD